MTDEEVDAQSTEAERAAKQRWLARRERYRDGDPCTETDLLQASQDVGILVERNKRLGLIK
jgi:hypothetical protein